jgi:type II secretory pathway pseudopilin PulG
MKSIAKKNSDARLLAETAGRAFTLSEMLVAVAAVAVISVGLAAVFQTVGRTVTTGKRLSTLNQQAAVLEAQLRQDISGMTRDGILVMRHQFTNLYGPVPGGDVRVPPSVNKVALYQGQPDNEQRARRIDELMFFANGEFRTVRQALIPGRTATARSARIYYGHGMRSTPVPVDLIDDVGPHYNNFSLPDFRGNFNWAAGQGAPPASARPYVLGEKTRANQTVQSPNEFASSWTLVRHATLLTGPSTTESSGWPAGTARPNYYDSFASTKQDLNRLSTDGIFQIAGQPATPTIFRTLNDIIPMGAGFGAAAGNRNFAMYWSPTLGGPNFNAATIIDFPRFVSGVVDISTSDLRDLSLVINGMSSNPQSITSFGLAFYQGATLSTDDYLRAAVPKVKGPFSGTGNPSFRSYVPKLLFPPSQQNQGDTNSLAVMQGWMVNALPTVSGVTPTVVALENIPYTAGGGYSLLGQRIRCEPELPDLRGTLDLPKLDATNAPYAADASRARAVDTRRVDSLALGANVIAPRCSEFIVEWSFGQTYPDGSWIKVPDPADPTNPNAFKQVNVSRQIIWYGGTENPYAGGSRFDSPRLGVFHYNPQNEDADNLQLSAKGGQALVPPYKPFEGDPEFQSNTQVQNYFPSTYLIHGTAKRHPSYPSEWASLISYFGYIDPTFTPQSDGEAAMPWPWPKLIRVTFTLADAADPSLEQTFQYVFDLPKDPQP